MTAITIVGAGSVSFTRTLVSDLLQQPATRDCELHLFDIDAEALEAARQLVEQMREEAKAPGAGGGARRSRGPACRASTTSSARSWSAVAPRLSPTSRSRRATGFTTPSATRSVWRGFHGHCGRSRPWSTSPAPAPTSPPTGCCSITQTRWACSCRRWERLSVTRPSGLCHSADYTVRTLASYLELPSSALQWWSAGINHLAWMLSLTHDGRDCYPDLARAAERDEVYAKDRARFELMKRVGYFVTESSKHVSEYLAFFIDKQAEIERLAVPVGEFLTRRPVPLATQLAQEREGDHSWLKPMSNEYAPALIAARESGTDWSFQANVLNDGLIDNLTSGMCVEVPCFVTRGRLAPGAGGELPLACGRADTAVPYCSGAGRRRDHFGRPRRACTRRS